MKKNKCYKIIDSFYIICTYEMIEHEEHVYKETECTGVYWSYELLILVSSISWFSGLGL